MDINNEYGVLEIQKQLLGLLKAFHSFCVDKDIKYSLDWGTLLGAVRHKGFIPWDDDLDIMMDRANYNKLKECINRNDQLEFDVSSLRTFWIPRVRLANYDNSLLYPPTIDILIMDNAPDGKLSRKWRLFLIMILQGMMKVSFKWKRYKGKPLPFRIFAMLTFYAGKPFSHATKSRWYNKLAQLSNGKETTEITSYYEEFNCLGKYYRKDLLQENITTMFEGIEAFMVKDYHECLTIQFGPNYMTPIKTGANHMERVKIRRAE